MDKQNLMIPIIGSAITLSLTACGGNTIDTFESVNVDSVVDISSVEVTPITLGASLHDYYDGKVTTAIDDSNTINNEDMVSNTMVELEVSEIPVPPTETVPTTTTRQTTVTTQFDFWKVGDIYQYGTVNISSQTLNVRTMPSSTESESTVIGHLKKDSEVIVCEEWHTSQNETWYYISYNNGKNGGFVYSGYIKLCGGDKEKPVIYLYPPKETEVSVELSLKGNFTYTYPEYANGWHVTARPDGTITDSNGNEYSYLFWEGNGHVEYDLSKGFVVERSNVTQFLRGTLLYLGLSQKEANDFIVYWSPRLMKNAYSLVTFQSTAYEDYAKLSVSPKPDSILRVFMVFKAVDRDYSVTPQELSSFERVGFTVVEWGGEELTI